MRELNHKKFKKTVENFICEHCHTKVIGNGYTNHCPHCLWSKHVDINPGDRQSKCLGMMRPASIEKKGSEYSVVHSCISCSHSKKNKINDNDNFDEVTKISSLRNS